MESESAFHIKSLFLQGSYRACIATSTSDAQGDLPSQLYAARSHIALSETDAAVELLANLDQDDPSVKACTLLAERVGTGESVMDELHELLPLADEGVVRPVAGTILQLEGHTADAINLLADAGQDMESVALHIQILLSLNRLEAARRVYNSAQSWAEDSFLIQLCEAWIGLMTGGDAYQSAYYVYDEIAQLPSANNSIVLNGKAVAQACMGNWPESEAALTEALSLDAGAPNTNANLLVVLLPSGKPPSSPEQALRLQKLQHAAPNHPLVHELDQKSQLFDECASKFSVAAA